MYRAAGNLLLQYPVWGIGIGSMPVAITQYAEYDVHSYIERLHNDWLEIALGVGLTGSVLILIGLGWFIYKVLRRLKRLNIRKQFLFVSLLTALVAMSVGSTVDFHFFIPGCALVFFLVLGLILTPTFHKEHLHRVPTKMLARLAVLLLLIAASWIPLQKTRAWRAFLFGKGLKTEQKLEAYQTGLSYYPSPHYAIRLATAYYNAGVQTRDVMAKIYYFDLARDITQTYLELYPKDKELSNLAARVQPKSR